MHQQSIEQRNEELDEVTKEWLSYVEEYRQQCNREDRRKLDMSLFSDMNNPMEIDRRKELEHKELKEIDKRNCEFILQLIEENNQLRHEKQQLEEKLKVRGHWEL